MLQGALCARVARAAAAAAALQTGDRETGYIVLVREAGDAG